MLNQSGTAFELVANPQALKENAEKISELSLSHADKITDLNKKRDEEVTSQAQKAEQERLKSQIDVQQKRIDALKQFNTDVKSAIELGGAEGKTALDTALNSLLQSDQSFFTTRIAGYQSMVSQINSIMSGVSNVSGQIDTLSGNTSTSPSTPSKSNQLKYLENLSSTGTSGQKKWADSQIKMGKYHDGIENGLVGGIPMPKSWEQTAMLAKGEGVFNMPQMSWFLLVFNF